MDNEFKVGQVWKDSKDRLVMLAEFAEDECVDTTPWLASYIDGYEGCSDWLTRGGLFPDGEKLVTLISNPI